MFKYHTSLAHMNVIMILNEKIHIESGFVEENMHPISQGWMMSNTLKTRKSRKLWDFLIDCSNSILEKRTTHYRGT